MASPNITTAIITPAEFTTGVIGQGSNATIASGVLSGQTNATDATIAGVDAAGTTTYDATIDPTAWVTVGVDPGALVSAGYSDSDIEIRDAASGNRVIGGLRQLNDGGVSLRITQRDSAGTDLAVASRGLTTGATITQLRWRFDTSGFHLQALVNGAWAYENDGAGNPVGDPQPLTALGGNFSAAQVKLTVGVRNTGYSNRLMKIGPLNGLTAPLVPTVAITGLVASLAGGASDDFTVSVNYDTPTVTADVGTVTALAAGQYRYTAPASNAGATATITATHGTAVATQQVTITPGPATVSAPGESGSSSVTDTVIFTVTNSVTGTPLANETVVLSVFNSAVGKVAKTTYVTDVFGKFAVTVAAGAVGITRMRASLRNVFKDVDITVNAS